MLEDEAGKLVSKALMQCYKTWCRCAACLLDAMGSKDFLQTLKRVRELRNNGVHVVAALTREYLFRSLLRSHRLKKSQKDYQSLTIRLDTWAPIILQRHRSHQKPKFAPWVDASVRLTGPDRPRVTSHIYSRLVHGQ